MTSLAFHDIGRVPAGIVLLQFIVRTGVADDINVHEVVIKDHRYADDVDVLVEQKMQLQCFVD